MIVLGLNSSFTSNHHDPSAALIVDGITVAAVEEERLNRIKTSLGYFPTAAINECLKIAGISISDVDIIASPGLTSNDLVSKISSYMRYAFGRSPPVELYLHPDCHASSAFYGSGFREATVFSVDGYGDGFSTKAYRASGTKFSELECYGAANSLGNFYGAFTEFLGFSRGEGEFKVMGMAAYGDPNRFDLSSFLSFDGHSYTVNPLLRTSAHRLTTLFEPSFNEKLFEAIGCSPRRRFEEFRAEHFDLAASVQQTFENAYLGIIRSFADPSTPLCLAGGCALNCLANGKLLATYPELYVMPAASDRGLSLGAAMEALRTRGTTPATPKTMLLGSGFTPSQIISTLKRANVEFMELEDPNLRAAEYISEGRILGWFNGRAEFGPRALGARSIIARADVDGMKDSINKKIKFREKYRPFAPAVLESELCEVDHNPLPLRYMTIAIRPDQRIRAHINQAVHKDGTARIQAINSGHPLEKVLTNLQVGGLFPGVINTSFNLAGEPIVNSPIDALRTFFSSGMDALIMENILVTK